MYDLVHDMRLVITSREAWCDCRIQCQSIWLCDVNAN